MSGIKNQIANLVRPEIQALKRYHVPDAHGLIKLDAMENPYSWPEDLKPAWLDALSKVDINRYPDTGASTLRQRLREALSIPPSADILLGNGSDELIQMVLLALARPDAVVMAPVPTFVMYAQIATAVGMRFVGVPLGRDFALDRAAMLNAIEKHRPAVIFLSYPNNPTANLFDADDVDAVLRAAPGLVVLDEAYQAFAGATFMDRLSSASNLLVMRTLSKQGMAGLRLGMLAGAPEWLAEFDKIRLPYNINSLTQASIEFALIHREIFDAQCRQICEEREHLREALGSLPGVEVWPSCTNFLLFRVSGRSADEVHKRLRESSVLIKNLDPMGGPLVGCLRVTVGTTTENAAFLTALRGIL